MVRRSTTRAIEPFIDVVLFVPHRTARLSTRVRAAKRRDDDVGVFNDASGCFTTEPFHDSGVVVHKDDVRQIHRNGDEAAVPSECNRRERSEEWLKWRGA